MRWLLHLLCYEPFQDDLASEYHNPEFAALKEEVLANWTGAPLEEVGAPSGGWYNKFRKMALS